MPEPHWLAYARTQIGTREFAGPANSPTIMGWAKKLGAKVLGIGYDGDHVPWCGLFAAEVVDNARMIPPPIAVRASSWATWGVAIPKGAPGAILVFQRKGGGHVGFYVAEDATHYHVLGGNQGDEVNIRRIEKAKCVAIRWPFSGTKPGAPVIASPGAAAKSTSEA